MSDQVPNQTSLGPVDGRNLINVGGGLGVTSINGDPAAAQILSAGAGITIIDGGGGTHVISVAGGGGVVSINGDAAAAQTLVAGTNITITDLGGGAHRIAAAAGTGIVSINADGNATQTIVAGANITVTDLGGGAHRIAAAGGGLGNVVSINGDASAAQTIAVGPGLTIVDGGGGLHTISLTAGSGVTSINGDTTPAQVLSSLSGALIINNPGAGIHNFSLFTFNGLAPGIVPGGSANNPNLFLAGDATWKTSVTANGAFASTSGIAIPNSVLTDVVSVVVPAGQSGSYIVLFGAGVGGVAAQIMDVVIRRNGAVQAGWGFSGMVETAAQTLNVSGAAQLSLVAGDTVSVAIDHHGGGAATTSTTNNLTIIRHA
jgi:hypothetical protein